MHELSIAVSIVEIAFQLNVGVDLEELVARAVAHDLGQPHATFAVGVVVKDGRHRVVNPPRELWHTSRFSIPFFLHPKSEMDLTSLESCVDKNHPKVYPDVTAGEYLDERLREIGLKK